MDASSVKTLLRILSTITGDSRRTAVRIEAMGTFAEVNYQVAPGADPQNPESLSIFIDAELSSPTTRAQVSLGVAIEIASTAEGGFEAVPTIGWQTSDGPGSAPATDWDFVDCDLLSSGNPETFFKALPEYARGILSRYEELATAYSRLSK